MPSTAGASLRAATARAEPHELFVAADAPRSDTSAGSLRDTARRSAPLRAALSNTINASKFRTRVYDSCERIL